MRMKRSELMQRCCNINETLLQSCYSCNETLMEICCNVNEAPIQLKFLHRPIDRSVIEKKNTFENANSDFARNLICFIDILPVILVYARHYRKTGLC